MAEAPSSSKSYNAGEEAVGRTQCTLKTVWCTFPDAVRTPEIQSTNTENDDQSLNVREDFCVPDPGNDGWYRPRPCKTSHSPDDAEGSHYICGVCRLFEFIILNATGDYCAECLPCYKPFKEVSNQFKSRLPRKPWPCVQNSAWVPACL